MNDNKKFIGAEDRPALLPVYKGSRRMYWPGQLAIGKSSKRSGRFTGKHHRYVAANTGLRRYVFRYENGTFVYLATRKGQRNGGFDVPASKRSIVFNLYTPSTGTTRINDVVFTFSIKTAGEEFWYHSSERRIKYDLANTRWVLQYRPGGVGTWYDNAFSSSTLNTLGNSSSINQITWTYIENPDTTATPQVPAIVNMTPLFYYKNNSVEGLNRWPIQNVNADVKIGFPPGGFKWQGGKNNTGRIACLTDSLLFKCFEGIPLKPYDIVFVEIVWYFFMNKSRGTRSYSGPNNSNSVNRVGDIDVVEVRKNCQFGYKNIDGTGYGVNALEWWSPAPFTQESQKGRIYRIGKLEADNGINGYDKVTFAQRTRLVTTRFQRGGFTALED